jgi:UDP-glucose 4-epimerase
MSCIVTGAAGFIGSHLSEALVDQGFRVTGIDRFSDFYPRGRKLANVSALRKSTRFRLVEADLASVSLEKHLKDAEYVFHLAAQPGVRTSWGSAFTVYVNDNVLATQRLLEAAKSSEIKRLILASSSSVYGDSERFPTPEDAIPRPISPYGVTKLAAENLCSTYFKNYGVETVSLRYFTVYGPRQRPDMAFSRFIIQALKNRPIQVFGDGDQIRDFTFVDDIVQGTISAMERGTPGTVLNLGGGSPRKLSDVIDLIAKLVGRECKIEHKPPQRGDIRKTSADISRARAELGYSPKTDIEKGLRAEVDWYRTETPSQAYT